MKKKLFWALTLCLVLALAFTLVACGKGGDDDDESADNEETGATFDYDASTVNAQLIAFQNANGYIIRYESTGTQTDMGAYTNVSIGAKGNLYYIADENYEVYYDLSDENNFVQYSRENDGEWTKETTPYNEYFSKATMKATVDSSFASHSGWLTYYENFTSSFGSDTTKTTATVAGRSCDKFSFSAAALTGVGLSMARASYSCYVDKSTSICLKWEYSATVDGKTESWGLECKEFNTNPDFTLPTVSEE